VKFCTSTIANHQLSVDSSSPDKHKIFHICQMTPKRIDKTHTIDVDI